MNIAVFIKLKCGSSCFVDFCSQVLSFITISCSHLPLFAVLTLESSEGLNAKKLTAWIPSTIAKPVITPSNHANNINKFAKHLNKNPLFVPDWIQHSLMLILTLIQQ